MHMLLVHFYSLVLDARRRSKAGNRQEQDEHEGQAVGSSLFEERGRTAKDKAGKAAPPKSAKLTAAQLRELEAKKEQEAVLSYRRVKDLWARMLAGDPEADREWMHEAESLVESFRETRALFLSSRVYISCFHWFSNIHLLDQQIGFRSIVPRQTARAQNTEMSEENMASRLQLELGI